MKCWPEFGPNTSSKLLDPVLNGPECGLPPQKPCFQACQDKSFLHSSCPGLLQISRVRAGGTFPKETTPLPTPSRLIPRHTIWHTNSQKSELSQLKCAYMLQALLPFHFIPFHFTFHKFMYAITSSVEAYISQQIYLWLPNSWLFFFKIFICVQSCCFFDVSF